MYVLTTQAHFVIGYMVHNPTDNIRLRVHVHCIHSVPCMSIKMLYNSSDEDALNEKFVAMKRTPKKLAKHAVYDIAVFRSKDKPAQCFRKLGA